MKTLDVVIFGSLAFYFTGSFLAVAVSLIVIESIIQTAIVLYK